MFTECSLNVWIFTECSLIVHWMFTECALKGGRVDWLVEKCTELGATRFVPLLTERSNVMSDGRSDRLERVALAAAKQCLRPHALQMDPPTPLQSFLEEVRAAPLALVGAAGAPALKVVLQQYKYSQKASADADSTRLQGGILVVGPEGDFSAAEVEALLAAGAVPVGLGPLRLRAETAAIALLAASTALLDDSLS
jgi:16S rRNA (uracil1498-N3)-methyltransferase